MTSLLRSKTFWGITSAAGGIASAVTYDNLRIKEFREGLLAEASQYGSLPSLGDQEERKVSLVLFASDSEDLKHQRSLFRKYSVDLLTKAGIDYQLIELDASQLDKRFYKDWETYQIDHDIVDETLDKEAVKPKVFFANNLLRPMMAKWMHQLNPWSRPIVAQPEVEPKEKIVQRIREESNSFRGYERAEAIGLETMKVIRGKSQAMMVSEILPSESHDIPNASSIPANIYS